MNVPALRTPIVMVHGFLGYDRIGLGRWTFADYFHGIDRYLQASGNRVLVPRLSPTAGIAQRAAQLKAFLDQHSLGEPVHILAHSMGGLDSRYMITHLGMADRVLTLTSLGTPHRGTSYIDWLVKRFGFFARPLLNSVGIPAQGFRDLTTASCAEFNRLTPNRPPVRYFSVVGRCEGPWLNFPWTLSQRLVERQEGPNDGVVSVTSGTYGEHTDVWEGDHLTLINIRNVQASWRGLWKDRSEYYGRLVRRLADEGY
ncbi:MAG TPA: alpha/beta fold hydrolase [Gemmataceae bacterium]|jgi:triacylglycerol lipase|nr:alpha/beta fold hydrolase [Gemmataceae bacterium]